MTTATPVAKPSWRESLHMCRIRRKLLPRYQNNCKSTNFHYFKKKNNAKGKDRDGIDLAGTRMKWWVKALSKYKLTETAIDVSAKGLNFLITPECVPIKEIVTVTEVACRQLKLENG